MNNKNKVIILHRVDDTLKDSNPNFFYKEKCSAFQDLECWSSNALLKKIMIYHMFDLHH